MADAFFSYSWRILEPDGCAQNGFRKWTATSVPSLWAANDRQFRLRARRAILIEPAVLGASFVSKVTGIGDSVVVDPAAVAATRSASIWMTPPQAREIAPGARAYTNSAAKYLTWTDAATGILLYPKTGRSTYCRNPRPRMLGAEPLRKVKSRDLCSCLPQPFRLQRHATNVLMNSDGQPASPIRHLRVGTRRTERRRLRSL